MLFIVLAAILASGLGCVDLWQYTTGIDCFVIRHGQDGQLLVHKGLFTTWKDGVSIGFNQLVQLLVN
jgi:hypothetical protein